MDLCTFFLVIAVLSEHNAGSPISLTLWHLYKGGTPPSRSLLISLPVIRLVSMLLIDDGFIGTPGALSIVSCHLTAIGGLVEREIK